MAKLYFRYGSMGSSKTANALMVKYNYEERQQNVLLIKPSIDNRDGKYSVRSRVGLESQAKIINSEESIIHIVNVEREISPISCIIIDESQFLTKNQVEELTIVADQFKIPVICYGLRTDFRGNLFEGSLWLLSWADSIEEVKTICFCGNKATMNMRLLDGKPVFEGEQIQIGGNESYVSVCRKHFKEGIYKY